MTASESDRLEALRRLEVLDTPAEERFDRVVRLAQQLFDVPKVAVNLVDATRQFTKSAVGLPVGDTPLEESFCFRTIEGPGALVVTDAAQDERFSAHPAVVDGVKVRFYAGQPLAAPGGQLVGTLCLVDTEPRQFSSQEADLLADLATWVEQELSNDHEVRQAQEVQRRLLPTRELTVPGYQVAACNVPARHVGGDYYDWTWVDDRVQLVVADVMGKGMVAAMVAAGLRATLRGASHFNELSGAVARSAVAMSEDFLDNSTFVTLFACRLTPATGDLEYVDAGHGLALVVPEAGEVRRLVSRDLPLGALVEDTWSAQHVHLDPGDTLLVVSDGILDFFPQPADAMAAAARLARSVRSPAELTGRIRDLSVAAGPLADDVTALALRRES